jgi:putative transposase
MRSEDDLERLTKVIEVYNRRPFYGYRKVALELKNKDFTEKQVRLIMKKIGIMAIFPGKNLSVSRKSHKKYPYLLDHKKIYFPNQAWATDITYIKLNGCYVYLVAIIDIFSRKVLSWRISNTMDVSFCVECLETAIYKYGIPSIFNSDQGSQFTSEAFVNILESHGIRISMDGKGRALDNIYVERLWRSLKYEEIYLNCYENMNNLKEAVGNYFKFYNSERFHQSLEYLTPDEIYDSKFIVNKLLA